VAVLEQMYQNLKKRPRSDKVIQPPAQADADDSEDDSGDEMEETGADDGQAMAVDAASREDVTVPIVDEDGFQLVQGKGRRRR
jgi:pre-rRNA-processing protein TSR2